MTGYIFDIVFVLIVLATAFFVSRMMLVHAAASLIAVVVASQFAISTFEAVSIWVKQTYLLHEGFSVWSFVLLGSFVAACCMLTFLVRVAVPNPTELTDRWESIGGWTAGFLTGYVLASFLLTAVQTLPVPRDFGGAFPPELADRAGPVTAFGPDYQFLALTEYVCEHASPWGEGGWTLNRAVNSANLTAQRWESFPVRYALFQNALHTIDHVHEE